MHLLSVKFVSKPPLKTLRKASNASHIFPLGQWDEAEIGSVCCDCLHMDKLVPKNLSI